MRTAGGGRAAVQTQHGAEFIKEATAPVQSPHHLPESGLRPHRAQELVQTLQGGSHHPLAARLWRQARGGLADDDAAVIEVKVGAVVREAPVLAVGGVVQHPLPQGADHGQPGGTRGQRGLTLGPLPTNSARISSHWRCCTNRASPTATSTA